MLDYKLNFLLQRIDRTSRPLIAYSGGVDSSYLLFMAKKVLGSNALGIFINSPLISSAETHSARTTAEKHQLPVEWITINPLLDPDVAHNTKQRCYHCKKILFSAIIAYGKEHGFTEIWDGSNLDDRGEYRPGRAAIKELGVKSPLEEAELTKTNVRELARNEGLVNADKPAQPCLLTRFPYDSPTAITEAMLRRVAEGEQVLSQYLVNQYRLRQDGRHLDTARIEVLDWDMEKVLAHREAVVADLKQLGYHHIALDLTPFKSGSFDRERHE